MSPTSARPSPPLDAAQRSWLLADFHICLAECLGNRFLTSMLIDLSARTTLVSALYQSQSEAQTSNDDHAAIVAALADGDNALAERLMLEHIDTLAACLDASRAGSGSARDRLRSALAPDMPAAGARATQRRLKKL